MARKDKTGGTPATLALTKAAIPFVVHQYEHDPSAASYGLEAAEALGVDPARVFKTLLVDDGSNLAVGIVGVAAHLDLKAMATALGVKKVTMAQPATAERVTGYVVGGISPIGQKRQLPTILDTSAMAYETVLVSGGRRGFDVELAPADLVTLTRATIAEIAREDMP